MLLYHLPHLGVGGHSGPEVVRYVTDECVVDYKCHTLNARNGVGGLLYELILKNGILRFSW